MFHKFAFLWHLLVLLVSVWNLSHNNFVIPETRFYGTYGIVSDHLFRFLFYAPFLLPLWYRLFLIPSADLKAIGHLAYLHRFFAGMALVWKKKEARNFSLLLLICFLSSFPASYIMLDGSLAFQDIWQLWVIYGLSIPSSFFFLLFSLGFFPSDLYLKKSPPPVAREEGSLSSSFLLPKWTKKTALIKQATRQSEISFLGLSVLLLAGLYFLRLLISGPAFPRLEDEVAYYLQSLIFESGQLKAALQLDDLAPSLKVAYLDSLQIPYIFVKDNFFYSVHQHGYSMLLSLLGTLKAYVNYALVLLSLFLFYVLLRLAALSRKLQPWALFFFGSAPVIFFQSDSYMAHPLALVLSLLIVILYFSPTPFFFGQFHPKSSQANASLPQKKGIHFFLQTILLFFLGVALAFVRLQSALPLFFALLLHEIIYFFAKINNSKNPETLKQGQRKDRKGIPPPLLPKQFSRLFLFFFVPLASLFLLQWYAKQFQSQSLLFTGEYFLEMFGHACQSLGFGEGHGCFPTLGTLGYSFRKFILRIFEYTSTLNQEFNAFGLPLFGVLLFLLFRRLLVQLSFQEKKEPAFLKRYVLFLSTLFVRHPLPSFSAILISLHIGLFSLYFHNGGESFRGRYLLEIAPYLYLVFFVFLEKEINSPSSLFSAETIRIKKSKLFFTFVLILLATQLLRTRGGYFHSKFLPVKQLYSKSEIKGAQIQDRSLITVKEQLPFVLSFEQSASFIDEFGKKNKHLSKKQIRSAFQNGFGSLLARSKRIDPQGFFWDKNDNLLLGPLSRENALFLQKALGLKQSLRIEFQKPKILIQKRRLKVFCLARYKIQKIFSRKNKL